MTVTLTLSIEVARMLEEKAARAGGTLETYLEQLATNDVYGSNGSPALAPELPSDEFDRLLDELASGPSLSKLPAKFSRADIYADHD